MLQQCLDSFNSLLDDSLLPLAAFLLGAPPAARQRLCCLSSIARIQKNAFNDGGGNVGGSEGALVSRPALCALHLASIERNAQVTGHEESNEEEKDPTGSKSVEIVV